MKKSTWKKLLAALLALAMVFALAACGGDTGGNETQNPGGGAQTQNPGGGNDNPGGGEENPPAAGGTILWLSNISSGPQYEAAVNYANAICAKLGYTFKVVYGDSFNDPAGNLSQIQTGMTNDVVGIIVTQDGGVGNIAEEYPDLYLVGFNSDIAAVYDENGPAHNLLENDHWLGTIVDGHASGVDEAHEYAEAVINGGYKKVATITFPSYAYPQHGVAAETFRTLIDEYNATAADADKIEIVGDNKVLEFSPLEESWFMEGDNNDLDAIVGICAGTMFIYPTMKSAIASGLCSPDTKLLTGGWETGEDLLADIGGDGIIQRIRISPIENIAWALVMLDNAIQGKPYPDFEPVRIDSLPYEIDSAEDVANIMDHSLNGTLDPKYAQISLEDLETVLTRYNPDATLAQLNELFHSPQLTVDGLK